MEFNLRDGDIIRGRDSGRMFLVSGGRRHWILTGEAAGQFQLSLDNYEEYSDEELKGIPIGSPVADYPDRLEECQNCTSARAFLAKDLKGHGIECGPGSASNCYPLPLDAVVEYLDRFDNNEGCNQDYNGEFPCIDYKTTINEMNGIKDESLDFIVHCHVIEHSRNPLQALEMSYKKLKSGGTLLMAVPDKRYTFDKPRKLTKVKHLIEDYEAGISPDRDLEHVHCCKKIWVGSEYKMINEITDDDILKYLTQDVIDIHWHTFTDRSFRKLLLKTRNRIPWSGIKIIPAKTFIKKEQFIEFYAILTK